MAKSKKNQEQDNKNEKPEEVKPIVEEEIPVPNSFREIMESIAIAVILAFMFRTFIAELFVIPTGSMATTLYGRHLDLVCPECGTSYQMGTSQAGKDVSYAMCPNCGFMMDIDEEARNGRYWKKNSDGDRILVGKYPYHFRSPKRWDVAVFLCPGNASLNYIKRVVGLPGETLRVWHGDIYTQKFLPEGEQNVRAPFLIARKPPEKVLATMMMVYDNDCQSDRLRNAGVRRWTPESNGENAPIWVESQDGRAFTLNADKDQTQTSWLNYVHRFPIWENWNVLESVKAPEIATGMEVKPRLITDMVAYNFENSGDTAVLPSTLHISESGKVKPAPDIRNYGLNWVSDLVVEAEIDAQTKVPGGKMSFGLVKAGKTFWCNVYLDSGKMELSIPARPDYEDEGQNAEYDKTNPAAENYTCIAQTKMVGVDIFRFRFANVDQQLTVWVNDKVISFDKPTSYRHFNDTLPTQEDLTPVRIGGEKCTLTLSKLHVYRDIYYIAENSGVGPMTDYKWSLAELFQADGSTENSARSQLSFYSEPSRWKGFENRRSVEFPLAEHQFFMMGDNSANSLDCRCWDAENYVDESLYVGEAYFVLWPQAKGGIIPKVSKFRKIK